MAKKKLQDKVEIDGQFTFMPGDSLENMDNTRIEEIISEKLSNAGYDVYQSFNYKIVITPKK